MMLYTLYQPVTRVLTVFSPERPKLLEGAHSFSGARTERKMTLEGFLERKVE